jgi:hypothetical protein
MDPALTRPLNDFFENVRGVNLGEFIHLEVNLIILRDAGDVNWTLRKNKIVRTEGD